ncbi:putative uncharacterized protein [Ruminococcus sp. CAG:488]|nr:putative uncharacterized protein [Ruminococcus sp. CAG:488]
MVQPIERIKREKIFSVVLTVLLLGFVGMVFYINFSINPEYYDGDIYNDINYAKEAWKAKSLFPKDWIFGNQTYVVATPVLAALFYGITGNGFTAMAIASSIMTVFVILTYDWMTRTLFSYNERTAGFLFMIGFLLLKAHVATSQQGIQAFFTMASYYACYLINAFIVYGCYVRIRQGKFTGKHIIPAIIGVALSFGTGMQSLRQTAVMALPLVACEVLLIIIYSAKDKRFAISYSTLFSAIVFIANIAGLVAMRFIEINQNSIYGTTAFVSCFKDFFRKLFLNMESVALTFGLDALELRVRLVASIPFLLIILIGFILCVKDYIKNKCNEQGRFVLVMLLTLGCVSVFAAGVLTDVVNRALYYFMIYPLLAVCVSYIIVKFEKKRDILFSVVAVFTAGMIIFRTAGAVEEIKAGKDKNSTAHQIANYMLDNGYDTIYSVFGLSGVMDGAENVVVASGDKIHIVQFKNVDSSKPMKPVEYLCVKDGYKQWDNSKSLYLLRDHELPKVKKIAGKYDVTMTEKARFGDGLYLYSMSENICIYTDMQK